MGVGVGVGVGRRLMTRGGTFPGSNTEALVSCIRNLILIFLGLSRYYRSQFCCPMKFVSILKEERKQMIMEIKQLVHDYSLS